MGYSQHASNQLIKKYAPLVDAAMEIKLEATTAHLWFEKIVNGDQTKSIEDVIEQINKAMWHANAMLEGGTNPEGVFIALKDPSLRTHIEIVVSDLGEFKAITRQRYDSTNTAGAGTAIDQEYERSFRNLLEQADDVETMLQQKIITDTGRLQFIQIILIASTLLVALFIGIIYYRFDRSRTEEKEEAQRESKKLFIMNQQMEYILGATKTGLDIIDPEFNMKYIDPEWGKIYGDYEGRKCYEYFMGKGEVCEGCGIPDALKSKLPIVTEERLAKEGDRPIQVTTIPFKDSEGKWLVAEVNTDITERKRAEEKLKKSEELLRKYMDSATDGFVLFDSQLNLIDINKTSETIFGASRAETIGKNIIEIVPNIKETGRYDKYMEVINTAKPFSIDDFVPHPKFGDMHLILKAFKVGEGLGIIFTDITERKQAELNLKRFNKELEELEHIISVSPGVAFLWRNAEGWPVEYVSDNINQFGYTPDELYDGSIAFSEMVHPDDLSRVEREVGDYSKSGVKEFTQEYRMLTKDGRVVWIDDRTFVRRDSNDNITHYQGIMLDITEKKRAEEALKQALADKDLLMREIHHRVKNNLTVVQSLLSLQSSQVSDTQTKGMLDESKNRVKAMSMIHDRLSKSSDISTIDGSEYISSLTKDLFKNYQLDSAKVTLELNLPLIHIDVDKIIPCGLITNELVSNALKYAFPEGREGTLYVGIEADKTTGNAMLVIRDNGVGLPDNFDINTTNSLGMQIVDSLSRQIGREVEIVRDNGTEFRILLKEVRIRSYQWDDETYGSSIAEIDKHHMGLISLLNQLKSDIESGRQDEAIKELIPKLVDYTVIHFSTEEGYMLQYDYPGTDAHKAEHEQFIKEVSQAVTAIKQGQKVLSYEVYEFLANWVEKHIAEVDKQLLDYLNAKMKTD